MALIDRVINISMGFLCVFVRRGIVWTIKPQTAAKLWVCGVSRNSDAPPNIVDGCNFSLTPIESRA